MQYDGYERALWRIDAAPDKVMVINTLVVDPDHRGMQIGQQMVDYAKRICCQMGCQTIRLSTYNINVPAIRLYQKCGFAYLGDLDADTDAGPCTFAMLDWLPPSEAMR